MKRLLLIISMLLALVLPANATTSGWGATCTTGGTAGCLDNIDGNLLEDGHRAFVVANTLVYMYRLDGSSGAAESPPEIIAPDSNAGSKRWILVPWYTQDPTDGTGIGDRDYNDARYPLRTEYQYVTIEAVAGALIPRTTNGAEEGTNEYATNDVMYDYKAFDGATEEYVAINFPLAEQWDRATVKATFFWVPGSSACTAGDTVEWEIAALGVSDDDAIDTAYGTSQVISDTVLAGKDADMHVTSATPSLTIGGTPALGDMIQWAISRNVGGTDDMTEDAWLLSVRIQILLTREVSAW